MRIAPGIPALLATFALSSCGTYYHLPGHSKSNSHSPPDITMTQGESKLTFTAGLNWPLLKLAPRYLVHSSNPEVVEVRGSGLTVRLAAKRPGVARVFYYLDEGKSPRNRGFQVTVLPAKP